MNRLHNIQRLDVEKTRIHAWLVDVRRNNIDTVKKFSDAIYGGKRKALQAAIIYRDQILAKIDQYEHQIWSRTIVRRNNKSGIPGVFRYDRIVNSKTGNRQVYWIATWANEYGANRQRRFSIPVYGELKAKQLAIAERERQLAKICSIKGSHWSAPSSDIGEV